MSVEILSVSLSDESIERIAQRVAQLTGGVPVTQSNPPSPQTTQPAESPGFQPQGQDPWDSATPANQWQPHAQPQQQAPQQQYQAPPQQAYQQQGQAPVCAHGPMRFVQAGVSGSGKPYGAFWGCSAPRGPGQCKSVRV